MKILDKITDKLIDKIWLSLEGHFPDEDTETTLADIDGNDVADIDSNIIGTL